MTKIFIAEEIPSFNKGEAAILFGMLESFRSLGDVEVSLLSFHPEIDRPRYEDRVNVIDGIKDLHLKKDFDKSMIVRLFETMIVLPQYLFFMALYKIFGLNALKIMKKEIWKEYGESDLIIIGHDGTFSGLFGVLPFLHLYSLFVAKLLRKTIIIYAGSVEVFKYKLLLIIAKFILNRVDLVTLRDERSYEYVQDIGIDMTHVHLTTDLAYISPLAPLKRVKEIMSQEHIDESDEPVIGITVTREICRLAFSDIENTEKRYQKSIKLFSQVVDYLTNTLNATVIFIPHCIGPSEELDDRIVASDIYQLVENKNGVKVIAKECTPSELKGLIGQSDLFIGERLHSVVGSVLMHVPSIAILYPSPRNKILSGVLDERWLCDIKIVNFNTLTSKIDEIWSEREKIQKDLASKVDAVKKRALLNGELLKDILRGNKQ
jgi:polysaccharide pyruvyl transferase WcaK-like protein